MVKRVDFASRLKEFDLFHENCACMPACQPYSLESGIEMGSNYPSLFLHRSDDFRKWEAELPQICNRFTGLPRHAWRQGHRISNMLLDLVDFDTDLSIFNLEEDMDWLFNLKMLIGSKIWSSCRSFFIGG